MTDMYHVPYGVRVTFSQRNMISYFPPSVPSGRLGGGAFCSLVLIDHIDVSVFVAKLSNGLREEK